MTGPASDATGDPAEPGGPVAAGALGAVTPGAADSPREAGAAAGRGRSGGPGRGGLPTRLILIAAGVLVLALVVALFFTGLRVGENTASDGSAHAPADAALTSPGASASSTPTPAATLTPAPAPTEAPAADAAAPPGPLAPGVHAWDALHGGECLTGYSSPWVEEFTVVDCAEAHTAQLVSTGLFPEDAAAAYPGEAELTSRLNLLCTAPAALDYAAGEAFADLQWQASYPADEAEWAAGARGYSCFFTRSSGEPLTGSLAAVPAG
ncbi:septum formation family protein [Herbiconiux sp. YIM B11900]|uniref:septum formation family protein n=1 Tax=Herbiconiux sp. YIM B11900 TaxID=3404131 RepID=UPI003F862060